MYLYISNQFILLVFFIILNPYIKSIMLITYRTLWLHISTVNAILILVICNLTSSSICIIPLGKLNETLDSEPETLRSNDPVYWFTEVVGFKHYLIDETKSTIRQKGSIQVGLGSIHTIRIIGICCDFCYFRSLRQLPNTINLISSSVFLQFRIWIS